jgi:DNA-directed RNA polymerase specialized sigma24 family protein
VLNGRFGAALHDRTPAADRPSAPQGAHPLHACRPRWSRWATWADDTQGAVFAADETEAALARIAALPPDQREVILLRVLAGLDVAEVAETWGRSRERCVCSSIGRFSASPSSSRAKGL